jgi:ribonuclease BN (tRNA processing enzyme)
MGESAAGSLIRTLGRVRFTVLGSSGTYPTPTNPASSYLLQTGDVAIWCDAGPGGFQALASIIDPGELDAIVVSHRHPDHCVDLFAAFHALTYRPEPICGVPLFANRSVIEHVTGFLDADDDHAIHTTFDIHLVEPGEEWVVGDVAIRAIEMDHSVPTLGLAFESVGRRLFYTADTGPNGTWIDQIGSVELLVSEASLQGDCGGHRQHLTAAQAGEIASHLGATRLLLTHIPPHLDPLTSVREAEATYGRTVMAAVPGTTYEV